MSKLVITIDTRSDDGKQVSFELSGDKEHTFKIPGLLGRFIANNDDAKVYVVGAVTIAAEQNAFIARNILHDIANHQMHKLLSNANTILSYRMEVENLKENGIQ